MNRRLYKQVPSGSLSILSKRPSGPLGVDTITIQGLLLAMYLSDTSLASCCCPFQSIYNETGYVEFAHHYKDQLTKLDPNYECGLIAKVSEIEKEAFA
jgi:hypothetical protein